jgi:hypothetical protein
MQGVMPSLTKARTLTAAPVANATASPTATNVPLAVAPSVVKIDFQLK